MWTKNERFKSARNVQQKRAQRIRATERMDENEEQKRGTERMDENEEIKRGTKNFEFMTYFSLTIKSGINKLIK